MSKDLERRKTYPERQVILHMVKITLYNIGGPKEVVFIIIFYTSFVLIVCVPDSSKEPKEDMYLEYNVPMLRILPLRAKAQMRIIQQLATLSVFPHSIYIISKP